MGHFATGDKVILDNGIRGEIRGKAIGKDLYDVFPDRALSLSELLTNIKPDEMRRMGKPQLIEV